MKAEQFKGPAKYWSEIPSSLLYQTTGEAIRVLAHIKRRLGIDGWKIHKGEVSFALTLSKRQTHAAFKELIRLGLLRKVGEIGEEHFEFNEVTEARYFRREPKQVEPKREPSPKLERGRGPNMEQGGSQIGAGEGSQIGALKSNKVKKHKKEEHSKESQSSPLAEFDKVFPPKPL